MELEEGIEALAPNSHLVSERGQRPEDVVRAGDVVTMKVIKLDRVNRKISLSLKDFVKEQERREVQQYMADASSGSATLGELLGEQMRALMNKGSETEQTSAAPEAEEHAATPEPVAAAPEVEESATPSEPEPAESEPVASTEGEHQDETQAIQQAATHEDDQSTEQTEEEKPA